MRALIGTVGLAGALFAAWAMWGSLGAMLVAGLGAYLAALHGEGW